MTVHCKRGCWGVLLTAVLWPAAAWGQYGLSGESGMDATRHALSAVGTATVHQKATQLRLFVPLLAKGKTLEDALAKLKDREDAATAQLETLKADKKSIVFSSPSVSNVQSARKRQIEQMVMQQMRSRGKKVPKGLLAPQTVTVTAMLTAQWPLETTAAEKLLVFSQGIQEKIKAVDLTGSKEAEKLSPEEEEFEEEASQMSNQFGNEEENQSGPQLVFVAVLPKEERQKAMTAAVADARQQAVELAKAAGVELGPLVGLAGSCTGLSDEQMATRYNQFGGNSELRQMMARTADDSEGKQVESVGTDPSSLKFVCSVTTLYQMGK